MGRKRGKGGFGYCLFVFPSHCGFGRHFDFFILHFLQKCDDEQLAQMKRWKFYAAVGKGGGGGLFCLLYIWQLLLVLVVAFDLFWFIF